MFLLTHTFLGKVHKTAKQKAQNEAEQKTKDTAKAAMEWFYKHRVTNRSKYWLDSIGKARVPVGMASHPEDSFAARQRMQQKVDSLAGVMDKVSLQRTDIALLVWEGELEEQGITIEELDIKHIGEDKVKAQAITGDHTCGAAQKKHEQEPNEETYFNLDVEIICCPMTTHNKAMAYAYGVIDNYVKEQATGQTPWDIVYKVHVTMTEINALNISNENKKKRITERCDEIQREAASKYTVQSFGTYRVLGSKTGKLWDLLYKIFTEKADIKAKKGAHTKGPAAIGHFMHMAYIPDKELTKWAKQVYNKEIESKDFMANCKFYKKVAKVENQVVEFVNEIMAGRNFQTFIEVQKCLPQVTDVWFNQAVIWCDEKKKADLPPTVKSQLREFIMIEEKRKDDIAKGVVASQGPPVRDCMLLCLFVCHFVVILVVVCKKVFSFFYKFF
jgi:hypothetical protein